MKKAFLWKVTATLLTVVMSVGLLSCGDDVPAPSNQETTQKIDTGTGTGTETETTQKATLVGTWTNTWDSGYWTLTFNQDGTGSFSEYDHGGWEPLLLFTYTYSSGVITFIYYDDDDDVETARVVELTSTSLVLKDWPEEGGNFTFTKQGGTNSIPSLVGTWKYTFSSGYVLLTFNQDGTGVYREYDHGRWEESGDPFTYTYSSDVITFIDDGDVETARVVELTSTSLVLKDWPDGGNCTFYKQ